VAVALLAVALAIVLTQPSGPVTVPDVADRTEQAAGAALRGQGLVPEPSLASSATVASGLVISQAPAAGTVVNKGTHVSIVVSGGPATAALLDVKGLTSDEAAERLSKAGFKPTTRAQASTTVKSGVVIGTEPPAGTELQVGSTVTMLVSSGPAPVRLPDVVGQSQASAESALTNAELAVGTVTQQVSSSQPPGTVLAQSPAAGTSTHAGQRVELTVAQAPKEVAVPSVVGAAEAAAATALKGAGFAVKTVSHMTTEQSQVGVVLEQSPTAGSHARKGATVTIAVGVLAPKSTPTTTTPTTSTTTTTTAPTPGANG
jgi:beta-lactam-binding protein with PASTA domain